MRWGVLPALVLVAGSAVAAQQVNINAPSRITVSGCVERADQVATASPTGQTVDTDSLSFVLMRVTPGRESATAPAPVATSGASGSSQPATGPAYWLDAAKDTLNSHVGHEVEVQGTVVTGVTSRPSGSEALSLANAPRLKVDAIKMIGDTCKR